eukprot:scaffold2830_cov131-Cylindrotheca_fusiformis.AAC.52
MTSNVPKNAEKTRTPKCDIRGDGTNVVVVKIGGSSITNKAVKESVNDETLRWFAHILSKSIGTSFKAIDEENQIDEGTNRGTRFRRETAFIIVHGAGSFGHHTAKEYGLRGQIGAPNSFSTLSERENRYRKRGLAETRISVQKLNNMVVGTLVDCGVNAVGISPFSIPGLEAHLEEEATDSLERIVCSTIKAGLVPVLHGDACLYGDDVAILSGDRLVEVLGSLEWVTSAIFITDVDGVFNEDPRDNPKAELLKTLAVDAETGEIRSEVKASGSTHVHDVTGGLETKLKAATKIARSKNVTIVKYGTSSAEACLRGEEVEVGTLICSLNM